MVDVGHNNNPKGEFPVPHAGQEGLGALHVPRIHSRLDQKDILTAYASGLLRAIQLGDWAKVETALDSMDCDQSVSMKGLALIVNAKHPKFHLNALQFCCLYRAPVQIVQRLIEMRADIHSTGPVHKRKEGERVASASCLHMALLNGNGETARVLLEAGHSVNVQNSLGETPLIAYLKSLATRQQRDVSLVKHMVSLDMDLRLRDAANNCILGLCSEHKLWTVVGDLLDQHLAHLDAGGEVGVNRSELRNCLFHALRDGVTETSFFSKLGHLKQSAPEADVDVAHDPTGWAMLEDLFLKRVPGSGVQWRVLEEFLAGAEASPELLDDDLRDALVKSRNELGQTLLHFVCEKRAPSHIAKQLIDLGADVHTTAYHEMPIVGKVEGYTPLHFAALGIDESLVKVLIDAGAQLEVLNGFGESPLAAHISEYGTMQKADLILVLLRAGAQYAHLTVRGTPFSEFLAKGNSWEAYLFLAEQKELDIPQIVTRKYEVELDGETRDVNLKELLLEILALGLTEGIDVGRIVRKCVAVLHYFDSDKEPDWLADFISIQPSPDEDFDDALHFLKYGGRAGSHASEAERLFDASQDPYDVYLYLKAREELRAMGKDSISLQSNNFYPLT
ncbi:MAG: hypothetical protein KDD62_05755, partial [Bdellovibrionales bacterium]|nr:hypothetical protein [Bdellovibrionales bacterium]